MELLIMKQIMNKLLLFSLLLVGIQTHAQVLDDYVEYGLESNLAIKQKEADYRKSLLVLKEAKGLFYPTITLDARYSLSTGGRIIEFPIGDLLNPVYANLNNLYQLHGFPTDPPIVLDNEEFPFYRPKEQETKIRLIQPLFNPQIYFNQKIQNKLSESAQISLDLYKKNLVAEIKIAYYNFQKASQYKLLLEDIKLLLNENLRVNESLFKNDKVTIDHIYRSQAEICKLDQEFSEADKGIQMTKAYFNFLLNKPLDSEITNESASQNTEVLPMDHLQKSALSTREELTQLNKYSQILNYKLKMDQYNATPNIIAVVDYGFQGEKYTFNNESDFAMASLVLSWDIFKGFQNASKTQQTKIDQEILSLREKELKAQIELQLMNAYYDVESINNKRTAATQELIAATQSFKIINKKHKEGLVSLLEYLDSQNTTNRARKQLLLLQYDLLISLVELEKVAGTTIITD